MRRWLRVGLAWGPSAGLALATMLAWNAFWAGDSVSAIMTLVVLPLLLPSVAVCWLLIVLVSAIRTRTWTLWRSFAALVTLGALFPALWNVQVAQLVFPADPEATESLSVRLPLEGEVVVGIGGARRAVEPSVELLQPSSSSSSSSLTFNDIIAMVNIRVAEL